MKKKSSFTFDKFSSAVAKATGSPAAFAISIIVVIAWACCGPLFNYSNTWQLVINTGTTIITFLMVFVIQQAQNKDTLALQLKLNELIAATQGASNKVLNIEDMNENELRTLKNLYAHMAEVIAREKEQGTHHTLDETLKDDQSDENADKPDSQ